MVYETKINACKDIDALAYAEVIQPVVHPKSI